MYTRHSKRRKENAYEADGKSNLDYNRYVDVYGNYYSNRYACYDGITSDGREIKSLPFSFTHYVMIVLRHHVKHVRHAPKLYNHLTL